MVIFYHQQSDLRVQTSHPFPEQNSATEALQNRLTVLAKIHSALLRQQV